MLEPLPAQPHVVIAGGGVAALEALIALRDLAGDGPRVTLVAPEHDFVYRPLEIAEPFGFGEPTRHPLGRLAVQFRAELVHGALTRVRAPEHRIDVDGVAAAVTYDVLLIAVGAQATTPFPYAHPVTLGSGHSWEALTELLADIEAGAVQRLAFVVPPGVGWTLPLYEAAFLTAHELAQRAITGIEITVITPEATPLALFGPEATDAVTALLAEHRIGFVGASRADVSRDGVDLVPGGTRLRGARIVTLAVPHGPSLPGLPQDADGFIAVDEHGRVRGVADVYAAGDATTFPVKQGGLAAQQADAAAESIAAALGATVQPSPFRPILRGLLFAGHDDRWLRASIAGGAGEGRHAREPLWWPPAKIAGRYLAPYLYAHEERELVYLPAPAATPIRQAIPTA